MKFAGMAMVAMVVATLTPPLTQHALRLGRFKANVRNHGVVPVRWTIVAVSASIAGEVSVLVALVYGLAVPNIRLAIFGLIAAMTLFAAYCVYSGLLYTSNPTAPCGCGGTERSSNFWLPVRALLLAVGSAFGAFGLHHAGAASGTDVIISALIGLTLAGVVWLTPESLHIPGGSRPDDKYSIMKQVRA